MFLVNRLQQVFKPVVHVLLSEFSGLAKACFADSSENLIKGLFEKTILVCKQNDTIKITWNCIDSAKLWSKCYMYFVNLWYFWNCIMSWSRNRKISNFKLCLSFWFFDQGHTFNHCHPNISWNILVSHKALVFSQVSP